MKRLLTMFVTLLLLPLASFAGGLYWPGTVTVSQDLLNMGGAWSVRYNTAVSSGWISVTGGETTIMVQAVDNSNGRYFSCTIQPTDAKFATMQKMIYAGLGNGSYLSAIRNTAGKCTSLTVTQSSRWLN